MPVKLTCGRFGCATDQRESTCLWGRPPGLQAPGRASTMQVAMTRRATQDLLRRDMCHRHQQTAGCARPYMNHGAAAAPPHVISFAKSTPLGAIAGVAYQGGSWDQSAGREWDHGACSDGQRRAPPASRARLCHCNAPLTPTVRRGVTKLRQVNPGDGGIPDAPATELAYHWPPQACCAHRRQRVPAKLLQCWGKVVAEFWHTQILTVCQRTAAGPCRDLSSCVY